MESFTPSELLRIASALRGRADQRDGFAQRHLDARSSKDSPDANVRRSDMARSYRAAAKADRELADKVLAMVPPDTSEVCSL